MQFIAKADYIRGRVSAGSEQSIANFILSREIYQQAGNGRIRMLVVTNDDRFHHEGWENKLIITNLLSKRIWPGKKKVSRLIIIFIITKICLAS